MIPIVAFFEDPSTVDSRWRYETLVSGLLNADAASEEGWERRIRYARKIPDGYARHARIKYCRDKLRQHRKNAMRRREWIR